MNRFAASAASVAFLAALACCALPAQAITYADTFVVQQFTTAFGSGSVIGAPDGGGRFLGDTPDPPNRPGYVTVRFTGGLTSGPGADLQVIDIASSAAELADIYVSPDNLHYVYVGTINAVANTLDFGAAFDGVFYYVRVANATTTVSMDVDTIAGFFNAPAIPEPSTYAMFAAGLVGLASARLRKQRGKAAEH